MAFENVNVLSLKMSLHACKNSLNHNKTDILINHISNSNVWHSESQKKLKNALVTLVDERYTKLQKKLDDYLTATSHIQEYKELEEENRNLELTQSIMSNDMILNLITDDEIGNITKKINENKTRMETLKNKVSNLI